MTNPQFAALIAFFMSLILAVAKGVVWVLSGSATVLASFADSVQDCFLSATNFMAVRYAMRPADNDHRYGHGKMEGIAALAQAAFIAGSCVFIVMDAVRRFTTGQTIEHPMVVVGVIIAAIAMNGALVLYQNYVVKHSKSLAIEADRAHYSGDIGIHIGVLIAVAGDYFLGLVWLDSVLALAIAVWLVFLAVSVGRKAIDMLMDKELPEAEREAIKNTIRRTKGVMSFHDLRTHRSGQMVMMSFDIEVDPSLTFIAAHDIAKRAEDRLHKIYPQSEIMIHVDPCGGDITDSRHRKIKHYHVK